MKQLNYKTLFLLFKETFKLSAFTIGGGYVIVPLMKKRFVQGLGWISEDEMLDFVSMAQSCPGAMAVNASLFVGYKMAGFAGQVAALAGTVLPPLLILAVISYVYAAFAANTVVGAVLTGMSAGVCAVMADVVISMVGKFVKNKNVMALLISLAAFICVAVFNVNIVYILAVACILGLMINARKKAVKK